MTQCSKCKTELTDENLIEQTTGVEGYKCPNCNHDQYFHVSYDFKVNLKLKVPTKVSLKFLRDVKETIPKFKSSSLQELKKELKPNTLISLGELYEVEYSRFRRNGEELGLEFEED